MRFRWYDYVMWLALASLGAMAMARYFNGRGTSNIVTSQQFAWMGLATIAGSLIYAWGFANDKVNPPAYKLGPWIAAIVVSLLALLVWFVP